MQKTDAEATRCKPFILFHHKKKKKKKKFLSFFFPFSEVARLRGCAHTHPRAAMGRKLDLSKPKPGPGRKARKQPAPFGMLWQLLAPVALSLSAHVLSCPRLPVSIAGVGQQKKGGKPAGKAAPPKKTGARRASDDAEGVCVWREREKMEMEMEIPLTVPVATRCVSELGSAGRVGQEGRHAGQRRQQEASAISAARWRRRRRRR